ERVKTCIPPHLSYSSQFWTSHARTAVFNEEPAKEVKMVFKHERLLFPTKDLVQSKPRSTNNTD
ncbi:hypothetical protein CY34DRAFT_92473, partial [Suillus luteus UH-Slu-Lm8-n1]